MIKSNSFACQHFHFPGILIFMMSCCHSLAPDCLFMLPAFRLQSECSSFPSDEMRHPIFMTDGLVIGVLPQQQSTRFLVLHPDLPKWKVLPWGKHFSACKERKGLTRRFPAGKNLYLQEGDHMGWGVCNHPHTFSLLNLNSLVRSSFSLKNTARISLFI